MEHDLRMRCTMSDLLDNRSDFVKFARVISRLCRNVDIHTSYELSFMTQALRDETWWFGMTDANSFYWRMRNFYDERYGYDDFWESETSEDDQ